MNSLRYKRRQKYTMYMNRWNNFTYVLTSSHQLVFFYFGVWNLDFLILEWILDFDFCLWSFDFGVWIFEVWILDLGF